MRLNIITPCQRPVCLPIIACQLKSFMNLSIIWHVVYEVPLSQKGLTGHDLGHNFQDLFRTAFPDGRISPSLELISWTRNPDAPSVTGTGQRNEALAKIADGEDWVAFLDDDTLLPHDYESTVQSAIQDHPDAEGFIFQQNDNRGGLRVSVSAAPPRSFIVNLYDHPDLNGQDGCDTGQMLFKRKLIGETKWKPKYAADHEFYKDISLNDVNKTKIRWLSRVASIHNALR